MIIKLPKIDFLKIIAGINSSYIKSTTTGTNLILLILCSSLRQPNWGRIYGANPTALSEQHLSHVVVFACVCLRVSKALPEGENAMSVAPQKTGGISSKLSASVGLIANSMNIFNHLYNHWAIITASVFFILPLLGGIIGIYWKSSTELPSKILIPTQTSRKSEKQLELNHASEMHIHCIDEVSSKKQIKFPSRT